MMWYQWVAPISGACTAMIGLGVLMEAVRRMKEDRIVGDQRHEASLQRLETKLDSNHTHTEAELQDLGQRVARIEEWKKGEERDKGRRP